MNTALVTSVISLISALLKRIGNKESVAAVPSGSAALITGLLAFYYDAGTAEQAGALIATLLSTIVALIQLFRRDTISAEDAEIALDKLRVDYSQARDHTKSLTFLAAKLNDIEKKVSSAEK